MAGLREPQCVIVGTVGVCCLIIAAVAASTFQSDSAFPMDLLVDPETINLGVISPDLPREVGFVIRNPTSYHADSMVVTTSCGCSNARLDESEIAPGSDTKLRVEFQPHGRVGPSDVYILLDYRFGGVRRQKTLTIVADVRKVHG